MRLSEVLRKWRALREITLRELAAEFGISAPTLSRIEHGRQCDAETLVKILVWLTAEVPPHV